MFNRKPRPSIHPLLDAEKQRQAQQYEKEKRRLGLASSVFSLALLLAIYFSGLSQWLAHREIGATVIWTFLVYLWGLQIVLTLVSFPLHFYSAYRHEHKWGFSNHTVKSWLLDEGKAFLVGLILSPLLLGLLFWIMAVWPGSWWLIAGLSMALISVVFATLFPVVIMPLFNKYTPIENEDLTTRLQRLLERAGLQVTGFFKEDMSKQTKKENAFLAGLGQTRRVVLADNLMANMNTAEMESIIAHEVGHYRYRHLWKNLILGSAEQLVVFYLLNRAMLAFFPHFLQSTRWNLTLLPVFAILMGTISGFLFGPLSMALSRHFERQADRTALEMISDKRAFLTAMAGLANRNLFNACPSRWIKLLYYSHPPIGERLAMGEKYQNICSGRSSFQPGYAPTRRRSHKD